ncbi:MAG: DUF5667 domain-containing protein, partial [Dehalococcoidia bacterium]|nr:DUF5667 domain-containing protein [Dehalococcoidia bacterium]
MPRVTPDLLASCLSEVKSGRMTIEECLVAHPEEAEELRRLLVTAATLRPQLRVEPDPAFRLRARVALVEAISAEKESASRSPLGRLERWLSPVWRDPARLANLRLSRPALVVILVIALTGVVGGGATFASQSALPGDALYPVKITVEGLQVRLIPGDEGKAEANVSCAGRRLDEAQQALEMGRSADVVSAMEGYSRCLDQAEQSLSRAAASGVEVSEVATRLSAQLANQSEKLASAEGRAPEEGRAIWSRALEQADKGMDTAIAFADRKEGDDRREAAPTIPPARTATPRPSETATRGGDEGESRPTPVLVTPGALETKLAQALSDVQKLKDDPAVSGENYEGLQGKLLAAREAVERGRNNAALNELGAFLGQLNAMQQSRHVSAGSYGLLYSDYASLVSSLGGTPGSQAELNRSTPTSGPRDASPEPKAGSGDDQERRGTTPTAGPERTSTPGSRVSPTPEGRPAGRSTDPEDKATPAPSPVRAGTPTPTPNSQDDSRSRPDGRGDGSPQPTPASTPTRVLTSPTPRPDPEPTRRPETPAPSASPTQASQSPTPRSSLDGDKSPTAVPDP